MANEHITIGTRVKRGNGATPEVFTAIPGVFNITPPSSVRSKIDVTDLSDSDRRFKLGIRDNGEITLQYNWQDGDAQQDGLYSDYLAATLRNFQITYPDASGTPDAGGTDAFAAYVMSVTREPVEIDGRLTRTAVLAISGPITES
jgi:hypothetical protein